MIAGLGMLAALAGCGSSGPARTSTPAATASTAATVSTTFAPAPTSTPVVTRTAPPPARRAVPVRRTPTGGMLAGKVVLVDPGHNGANGSHPETINRPVPAGGFTKACDTAGTATLSGYTEAEFNYDVAVRLAAILRHEGARVVLTRHSNAGVGPCVNERAAIGNRAHADAAISIHADSFAPSGHGFHVIEPGPVSGFNESIIAASADLGGILRDRMAQMSGLTPSNYLGHDGIDVRTDLGGLNLSKVPKVFLESGNMQNPHDAALQTDPAWRGRLAHVIADVFTGYLGGR
ncbi:MAG: N-acetylmuramoyl-L-alanine amidase [Solirubrobacteraceae bacterium]